MSDECETVSRIQLGKYALTCTACPEIVQLAVAREMTALLESDSNLSFCRHAVEQTAVLTSLA